jgi:hypothetical protein
MPVVSHKVASLPPSLEDKLWNVAAHALLCTDLTDVPTHLETSNLTGLLEVWTTHAADNFLVQCALHRIQLFCRKKVTHVHCEVRDHISIVLLVYTFFKCIHGIV